MMYPILDDKDMSMVYSGGYRLPRVVKRIRCVEAGHGPILSGKIVSSVVLVGEAVDTSV